MERKSLKAIDCPLARATLELLLESDDDGMRCIGCSLFFKKDYQKTELGEAVGVNQGMDCEGPPSRAGDN